MKNKPINKDKKCYCISYGIGNKLKAATEKILLITVPKETEKRNLNGLY
jgi:hypothetical protein